MTSTGRVRCSGSTSRPAGSAARLDVASTRTSQSERGNVTIETLIEIRGLARDFARAELRPGTEHWDAAGAFDDAIIPKLAELGFFGMLVPETEGGMGFDVATYAA